jgi:hypothetical protein
MEPVLGGKYTCHTRGLSYWLTSSRAGEVQAERPARKADLPAPVVSPFGSHPGMPWRDNIPSGFTTKKTPARACLKSLLTHNQQDAFQQRPAGLFILSLS